MNTTVDSVLDGQVILEQPAPGYGYRFNEDAVLLARFATQGCKQIGHLIDLGAGVGAIALCAARMADIDRLTLVDLDPGACRLARINLERAGRALNARVIESSVEDLPEIEPAHVIVMNPPYTREAAGRIGKVEARDRARRGEVAPFLQAAAQLLAEESSYACVCQPAGELTALLARIETVGLRPRRASFVFPSGDRPARIVMIEMSRAAGPFVLE